MANRQLTVLNPGGYQELLQSADTLVVEGAVNMDSNNIGGLPAPSSDNDAARKKYIDDAIANVNLDLQGVTDNGSTTTNSISAAGGTFTGPITVGVDDTGHDVKFFGATAGKYCLWDEAADNLQIEGTANVTGEMHACGNDIWLRQLSSGVGQIVVDYATSDQAIVGGDQAFYINDMSTTPSHSNLTIDWDGNYASTGDITAADVTATGKVITTGIDNGGQFNIKSGGEFFHFESTGAWHLVYDDSGSGSGWSYAIDATKNYVQLYGPGVSGSTIVLETKTGGVDVTGSLDVSGAITAPANTSTHTLGGTLEVGGPGGTDNGIIKLRTRPFNITCNSSGIGGSAAAGYTTYNTIFQSGGEDLFVNVDANTVFVVRGSVSSGNGNQGTEELARFTPGAGVELLYDNSKKLETTTAGVDVTGDLDVTGDVTATAFIGNGSQLTHLPASSTPTLQQVTTQGTSTTTGASFGGDVSTTANLSSVNVTASGTVSAAVFDIDALTALP